MENPFLQRDHTENCPPLEEIWAVRQSSISSLFASNGETCTFFSPNKSMDLALEAYIKSNPISSTPVFISPRSSTQSSEQERADTMRSEMFFDDPKALKHLATPLHIRSTSKPMIRIDLPSPVPLQASSLSRSRAPAVASAFVDLLDDYPHTSFGFFSPIAKNDPLADDEFFTPSKSSSGANPFSPFSPIVAVHHPKESWNPIFSPALPIKKSSRKRSPTRSLFPSFMR